MKKNTYSVMLWFIIMLNIPAISYACYYVKQCLSAALSKSSAHCSSDGSDDDALPDDPLYYQHGAAAYKRIEAQKGFVPRTHATPNNIKSAEKDTSKPATSALSTRVKGDSCTK